MCLIFLFWSVFFWFFLKKNNYDNNSFCLSVTVLQKSMQIFALVLKRRIYKWLKLSFPDDIVKNKSAHLIQWCNVTLMLVSIIFFIVGLIPDNIAILQFWNMRATGKQDVRCFVKEVILISRQWIDCYHNDCAVSSNVTICSKYGCLSLYTRFASIKDIK